MSEPPLDSPPLSVIFHRPLAAKKWLREAETCETLDAPATCAAIVHNTVGLGVDEEDQLRTWLDDADT